MAGTWRDRTRLERIVPAVALAMAIVASASCLAQSSKGSTMDESQPLLTRMQALGVDAYLRKDAASIRGLPTEALQAGVHGLLLSAPRSLDGQSVLPVPGLLLMARTRARTVALPFRTSAIVVATDLDRGLSYAGQGFVPDPTKRPHGIEGDKEAAPAPAARPVEPGEEQAMLERLGHGDSATLLWFDFRHLLNLPRETARYLLRVIDFDDVSNPAEVQVSMPTASPDRASVEVERKPLAAPSPANVPGQGLPRYEHDSRTPVLNGPGAALAFGELWFGEGVRQVPVHGAIRLELTRRMIAASSPGHGDAQVRTPSAVLPASLLVLMKGNPRPMHLRLEIPVFAERELHVGDVAEAAFAADLATVLPAKPPAGVYQVYLLAGPFLSGPHALTVPAGR